MIEKIFVILPTQNENPTRAVIAGGVSGALVTEGLEEGKGGLLLSKQAAAPQVPCDPQ
jgi:hypothetical protein